MKIVKLHAKKTVLLLFKINNEDTNAMQICVFSLTFNIPTTVF